MKKLIFAFVLVMVLAEIAAAQACTVHTYFSSPAGYSDIKAIIIRAIDDAELRRIMRERHGVIIAGGLGKLRGRIIRVGHMGSATITDLAATMSSLEMALRTLGYELRLGAGVGALEESLLPYFSSLSSL